MYERRASRVSAALACELQELFLYLPGCFPSLLAIFSSVASQELHLPHGVGLRCTFTLWGFGNGTRVWTLWPRAWRFRYCSWLDIKLFLLSMSTRIFTLAGPYNFVDLGIERQILSALIYGLRCSEFYSQRANQQYGDATTSKPDTYLPLL